jgi:hypothetical protein
LEGGLLVCCLVIVLDGSVELAACVCCDEVGYGGVLFGEDADAVVAAFYDLGGEEGAGAEGVDYGDCGGEGAVKLLPFFLSVDHESFSAQSLRKDDLERGAASIRLRTGSE